MHSFRDIADY